MFLTSQVTALPDGEGRRGDQVPPFIRRRRSGWRYRRHSAGWLGLSVPNVGARQRLEADIELLVDVVRKLIRTVTG